MLVCLIHNKIVNIFNFSYIHFVLPQFLMDGPVNVLLFELDHFFVYLGTIDSRVRADCLHIWVG